MLACQIFYLMKILFLKCLQHRATPNLLSEKACKIINDKKYSKKIESKFNKLHKDLKKNTSSLIFKIIKPYLK